MQIYTNNNTTENTKNITVGTQVMTINTTARMATADYGNQKYQLSTCIGCGYKVETLNGL
jgi:hypothetical protein